MNRFRPWIFFCVLLASATQLHADAALLVEQPYGTFGFFNPTGHAAVYLSRVCAESPTKLRRCRSGELGAVISRYHKVGGRDWIAIPLIPYLYAVEHVSDIPDFADASAVAQLRNDYRQAHLQDVVPDDAELETPKGEWIQLVGSSYDRSIYGFAIETSEAQDDALIKWLNSKKNRGHFNLFFRNCADFSRNVINFYYPKALHRSIVADAGITTPKQMAKCMERYSRKHDELKSSAFVIPQVDGTFKRSTPVRGVFESLVRSKKYVVPLAVVYPWAATVGGTAYLTRGRFNPSKYARVVYEPDDLSQCMLSAEPNARCEKALQVEATVGGSAGSQ
ncbi:MAG TPA: hypothetical protein VLK33_02475 [Terriglobales bacterium]|nr:hypothetical protein [Terriglobales bacterium]